MLTSLKNAYASVPPTIRGVSMMLISAISIVSMNVCIRIVAEEVHLLEIAFFRTLFAFIVLLPWLAGPGIAAFQTNRFRFHGLRAVLNVFAMLLYFYGLVLIPLAKVNALSFTSPLFASLLAILILREKPTRVRVIGLVVGFLGAVVVLRPGFGAVSGGGLLILASTSIWACALIVIKMLARTDSSLTIALYAALLQIPMTFVPALFVWEWPTPWQLGMMAAVGCLGGLGQLALAQSFREADVTVVLPADFTKLIWASLAGFLVFAEIPDLWSWVGGIIIFSAVFYITVKDRRAGR